MEHIEIKEYNGTGYMPVIRFESWRVSLINYAEGFDKSNFTQMERHHLTDEVFILLEGKAQLIIGSNEQRLGPLKSCEMQRGFIYNIKKDVWHHIFVSRDACVLVVENENTSIENTEYTDAPSNCVFDTKLQIDNIPDKSRHPVSRVGLSE